MADIFTTLVANLNQMGFYGFVLPFLLVFAIVYALLERSKVLGEKPGPIGIVSLVIGFFVTAFSGIGTYLVTLFGVSTMFWAALLVVVLFFAFFGYQSVAPDFMKNPWFIGLLAVLAVIVVSIIGGASLLPNVDLNENATAAILMVVIIGLAVWFVMCGAPCRNKAEKSGP